MPLSINLFNTDVKASQGDYGTFSLSLSSDTEQAKNDAVELANSFTSNNFLPLSGGTLTGNLTFLQNISGTNPFSRTSFSGGQSFADGALSSGVSFGGGTGSTALGSYSFAGRNGFALGDSCTAGGLITNPAIPQFAQKVSGSTWRTTTAINPGFIFGGSLFAMLEAFTNIGQSIRALVQITSIEFSTPGTLTTLDFVVIREMTNNYLSSNSSINGVRLFVSFSGSALTNNANTAIGYYCKASGDGSTAIGYLNEAFGLRSTAFGSECKARGNQSVAIGNFNTSGGLNSIAMGYFCSSSGDQSFSVGNSNVASGLNAVALGYQSRATNNQATAIGSGSNASGEDSTAINSSRASGNKSFSAGTSTASGVLSFAVGDSNQSIGINSVSLGSNTLAAGDRSFACGSQTIAGDSGHSEGTSTYALGGDSHTEGYGTATGIKIPWNSATPGSSPGTFILTFSPSNYSLINVNAFLGSYLGGYSNWMLGGYFNAKILSYDSFTNSLSALISPSIDIASNPGFIISRGTGFGRNSHAEGDGTICTGRASHSEGSGTNAIGNISHAAGYNSYALHNISWIWSSKDAYTTRSEQFMVSAGGGAYFPGNVGIGTDNNTRALTVNGQSLLDETYSNSLTSNILYSNSYRETSNTYITINNTGNINIDPSWDGKVVLVNNASNLDISLLSSQRIGFSVTFVSLTPNIVSFSAGAGATLNSDSNKNKISSRYCSAVVTCYTSDTYLLLGNISN